MSRTTTFQQVGRIARHEVASDHFRHGRDAVFEVERAIIGVSINLTARNNLSPRPTRLRWSTAR